MAEQEHLISGKCLAALALIVEQPDCLPKNYNAKLFESFIA